MKFPYRFMGWLGKVKVSLRRFAASKYLRQLRRLVDRVRYSVRLVAYRYLVWGYIERLSSPKKLALVGASLLMVFSIAVDILQPFLGRLENSYYSISTRDEQLLDTPIAQYADKLDVDEQTGAIAFNSGYRPGGEVAGVSGAPKITAQFGAAPDNAVTVSDPVNNVGITFKPDFPLRKPRKEGNRVIYPLIGSPAKKVYTVQGSGVKEDIMFTEAPSSDELTFAYDVELPDGLEIRLENDGSLGVYGVQSALLGSVSTGSDADTDLLQKVRQNGDKTQLLFKIPAPFVVEQSAKNISESVSAEFFLDGDRLSLVVKGLLEGIYPLSVDPTIYVETAQKFMRGNNETNIDFDVDNELIQKSQTTGARIDSWNDSLDMDNATWDHASVAAGGYVYRTGGRTGTLAPDIPVIADQTETIDSTNGTSFVMNMPTTRPAGDLYVAVMCHDGTSSVSPPAGGGWTEYADIREHAAYYKIGTDQGGGNEASSYTWTGGSEEWAGVVMRVTGFDSADVVSGTAGTGSSASDAQPIFPATTPDNDSALVIRAMGADADEPSVSGWLPASHTKIASGGSAGGGDCAFASASLDGPPASGVSTGAALYSDTSVNDTYGASTIAINPTPSSPGSTTTLGSVHWAQFNSSTLAIESPNPGAGACTGWCNDSAYDLPSARRGHSMVAYNGYLYVIGGVDSAGARASTIYIAKLGANGEPSLWHPTDNDPDNWDYWFVDSGISGATAKSYLSAVAHDNRIYLVGGQTNASAGGVTTVEKADILPNGKLGTWTTTGMQVLPSGAGTHMAEVQIYNDTIYTIGGFEGVFTSSANLRSAVYYSKLNNDGTMNAWQSTDSFTDARANLGGSMSYIWGAYIYLGGGCEAVNASGYCTTVSDDIQLASINADGSLDLWSSLGSLDNTRIGYSLIGWQSGMYRLGGCITQNSSTGECESTLDVVQYGVINPAGEVSTVNVSETSGSGNCTGGSPQDCDLPPVGDGAGQGGQMLSASTLLNGFLYVIGGCVNFGCSDSSGNVSYVSVGSDGSLQAPASCGGTSYGAWCVDSTNQVNGTAGISATGITTFDGRIYLVGGIDNSADGVTAIHYNSVNDDGSLAGAWNSVTFATAGVTGEKAYTYAYARANPSSAGTNPGNLYIIGGCAAISASAGCSGVYNTEVYKCNITTAGNVTGCSTSGQLQLDVELLTETNQGLGLHSGTVYANYIYLIGGYSDNVGDRNTVFYAQFDDSNNIVDAESGLVAGNDDDWIESSNTLSVGRRRGWAFGYNGHVYAVGGYEDSGVGIIPFIEWSKLSVSDGSAEPFVTSSVTINQRWGLSMAVSNSYAYVIGGCDIGISPGGCSSFEPSIQTFQLYNNDSGSPDNYTSPTNKFATDRYGASAAVYNGYLYLAGGCTDNIGDCSIASSDVQYAPLDSQGDIGTWASVSDTLPEGRGWGQLEEAGGSLYWIGGEDAAGDEKSNVYYATPETTSGSAQDVFRSTTYEVEGSEFTGTAYTLTLNNNLASNYFTMITGSDSATANNAPDSSSVRVTDDPHGNFASSTVASDEIELTRGGSDNDWVGTVTVVECLRACASEGFKLKEVRHVSVAAGTANTLQSVTDTLSSDHTANTVPFGARYGGGMTSTNTDAGDFSVELGIRIQKTGTDQLTFERYGAAGRVPAAVDVEVYIVEWGDSWTVQEENFVDWTTGGNGANAASEYTTNTIASVTVDDTWLWKSPGTSEDDGLGDGAFGKVITLDDGATAPSGATTQLSIGSEQGTDQRRDTVYVMEHNNLSADYNFVTDNPSGTSETTTIAGATGSETYDNSATDVRYTEGYRVPFILGTESGTGNAFARAGGWYPRITADTTLTYQKSYSGNAHAAWAIIADFNGITYTPSVGDIPLWTEASNGLPADRTQFGAASWNDRLYVVGGLDDAASETNTVYVSPDLSSGGDIASAWSSDTDIPDVARSGNTVVAYANNLYTYGGHDGSNYLLDSQFTQINSDGTLDAWTFTTPLPDAVRQGEGFAANGYMYVIGGRSSDNVCDSNTYIAPISANTTIATGNDPTGIGEWNETNEKYAGSRYGNAVAYDEGRVYILGGACSIAAAPTVNGAYTFNADNDGDESAWTWVSDNGSNGLNAANTTRAWSHDTNNTTSGNVGPTSGQSGSPDGYVYTEASSPAAAADTFTTTLNTTLDASTRDWNVEFYWNQRGTNNLATVAVQTNENLAGWVTRGTYGTGGPDVASGGAQQWNYENLDLSSLVSNASTQVRFLVTLGSTGNIWNNDFGLDTITVTGVDPTPVFTYTGVDRVQQTALNSQPQVAAYSRLIDTDSDVFPNSWLLNGLDNSIGARWQVRYRSMNDTDGIPADCGTADMTTWGQETSFGDVTLGDVSVYTPLDGSGANTNCARYFYFFIEIDASQTFGYPEDVNRGPTIADLSLFFTSDPNKRLRHGKSFTGGEQQPLDTPCRQSVDADCPLP